MTFPIDFHRHPKIQRLPVEVRWTFVEMNGEARIADNDGVFSVDEAEFMWPAEHLALLCDSHPSRPLVVRDGDVYVIRDYGEHQQTRADRERLAEVSRANGALGGRPRKPGGTQTKPSQVQNETQTEPGRTQTKAESESESESELKTDVTYLSEISPVGDVVTKWTDQEKSQARTAGITNLDAVGSALIECCGPMSGRAAVLLSQAICARSRNPVKRVDGYVLTAVKSSPDDVRWEFERLDLGAIA
jgi:hypothetical protein